MRKIWNKTNLFNFSSFDKFSNSQSIVTLSLNLIRWHGSLQILYILLYHSINNPLYTIISLHTKQTYWNVIKIQNKTKYGIKVFGNYKTIA